MDLRYFFLERRETRMMILHCSDHTSVVMINVKTDVIILYNIISCVSVVRVRCGLELSVHPRRA